MRSNYGKKRRLGGCSPYELAQYECGVLWPGSAVVTVASGAEDQLAASLRSLVASLFFVEISASTQPHSLTQPVGFRLGCRLVPGYHLQNLMFRLRDERALIRFDGMNCPLCDDEQWEQIKQGYEYREVIHSRIRAPAAWVQVELVTDSGRSSISNCPFQLHGLASAQGLDLTLLPDQAARRASSLQQEIDLLHATIQEVLEETKDMLKDSQLPDGI
ncbi:hypothetical protein PG985_004872 [Apiospora marii]|uniref:uncharacterized protein n=1 Tax=Apiospora marii TaxID=335849 RepID=UPI003131A58E